MEDEFRSIVDTSNLKTLRQLCKKDNKFYMYCQKHRNRVMRRVGFLLSESLHLKLQTLVSQYNFEKRLRMSEGNEEMFDNLFNLFRKFIAGFTMSPEEHINMYTDNYIGQFVDKDELINAIAVAVFYGSDYSLEDYISKLNKIEREVKVAPQPLPFVTSEPSASLPTRHKSPRPLYNNSNVLNIIGVQYKFDVSVFKFRLIETMIKYASTENKSDFLELELMRNTYDGNKNELVIKSRNNEKVYKTILKRRTEAIGNRVELPKYDMSIIKWIDE